MLILLQKPGKGNPLLLEYHIIKDILENNRKGSIFHCMEIAMEDFEYAGAWENAVPIGTIEFVETWMKRFYNHGMNPVPIPTVLCNDRFLKRKYSIVKSKDIPRKGNWFVKDVSQLKAFSTSKCGDVRHIDFDLLMSDEYRPSSAFDLPKMNPDHLFQVSENVDILAEYRVYVIDGKIENICLYDGDFMAVPDMPLIHQTVSIYNVCPEVPASYNMDFMVIKDRGTALLEIHPFTSIGLYSTL